MTSRTLDVETTCPREHFNSAFGYKHLLPRHLAKVHSTQTSESDSAEPEEDEQATPKGKDIQRMDIDSITGMPYATQANERPMTSKALRCFTPILAILRPFPMNGMMGE